MSSSESVDSCMCDHSNMLKYRDRFVPDKSQFIESLGLTPQCYVKFISSEVFSQFETTMSRYVYM